MDKKKAIKIIVSIIFVPLIAFFALGIIGFIGQEISYLMTCIIIDVILIVLYRSILIKLNTTTEENNNNTSKVINYVLWTILAICTCGISLIIQLLIAENKKQIKKKEEEKLKEQQLINEGYNKIYTNLYINEGNKCILINGIKYGFSQIVDCELIENKNSINNTYGQTRGKMKNNGKIKTRTNTFSSEIDYCNELYLNITIDDFNNPNIKFNVRGTGVLNTKGEKYKNVIKKANEILSIFKLIISKNNEKYIENGTITKIEHRYITEETIEEQIKKLGELYKDGILTDYEFSTKKMELLEKLKK